jgi:hypothetical protein
MGPSFALMELYVATKGPTSWRQTTNWDSPYVSPCEGKGWFGVTCDDIAALDPSTGLQTIRVLDLSNNNLQGTLPAALFELGFAVVDFSNNDLSGSLPEKIAWSSIVPKRTGASTTARYLDYIFAGNAFTGGIPDAWGAAPSSPSTTAGTSAPETLWDASMGFDGDLRIVVNVGRNQLSGSIPRWEPPKSCPLDTEAPGSMSGRHHGLGYGSGGCGHGGGCGLLPRARLRRGGSPWRKKTAS